MIIAIFLHSCISTTELFSSFRNTFVHSLPSSNINEARTIEVKEAATPHTNWSYNGDTEGAIYGFEKSVENTYMKRIINETPVKGLYLVGAWENPGGGYTGALKSGQLALEKMMENWGG